LALPYDVLKNDVNFDKITICSHLKIDGEKTTDDSGKDA
jgi:hypothetical protein